MYRTVLVPLDGSPRAEAIMPHAVALARCTGAKLVLMRVVEPVPAVTSAHEAWPTIYIDQVETQIKESEAYLDAQAGQLREAGLSVETRVVHGPVVESIIDAAEHFAVDLIAMASHGRTGLAHVFYGSVAAGVLNRVDRPLMLVRSR